MFSLIGLSYIDKQDVLKSVSDIRSTDSDPHITGLLSDRSQLFVINCWFLGKLGPSHRFEDARG